MRGLDDGNGGGTGAEWVKDPFSQPDGMDNLTQEAAKLRFGQDLRLLEVRRLLRSTSPVVLQASSLPEASEGDGALQQQNRLMVLAVRTMALPLGRAALTLGTLRPLPTEPLRIPVLCLAGRLPEQNNALVNLDLSATAPAPGRWRTRRPPFPAPSFEMLDCAIAAHACTGGGGFSEYTAWAEFHNGVAAGLRLAPGGHQLTRTWIVYNKPVQPSYTHAGMLMALGLTGG